VIRAGSAAFEASGRVRAETGLAASLRRHCRARAADDPGRLGRGTRVAAPMSSGGVLAPALPGVLRTVAIRARHHPYVRLAVNGSFSALQTGQVISLLGDRVNQVALAALVYGTTNSAIAGLPDLRGGDAAEPPVRTARRRPRRPLGPEARPDREHLIRAGIVVLIPAGVAVNVVLAYPLVFLLTTVSIFFRPARVAVLRASSTRTSCRRRTPPRG